jgi:hypothetical protein
MTGITSRGAQTGARSLISGVVSNGSTWVEDVSMTEDGGAIANAEDWDWTMTFRTDRASDSADLTLSTDDGTLAISQGADATTLEIRVPKASLTAMEGDYICDLKSLDTTDTTADSAGRSIHWGSGVVTFLNEPI